MGARVAQDYGVTKEFKRLMASTAPFAYQKKTNPSSYKVTGKVVSPGSYNNGGAMNGGGKHRPGSRTVR